MFSKALEIVGTVTRHGFDWSSEELFGKHFQVVFRLLDDESFPVRVNAVLCLTEMITAYEAGKLTLARSITELLMHVEQFARLCLLRLGKLSKVITVEGIPFTRFYTAVDLLKMSDETDLDILNHSMETVVEQFPEELLPVAAMLAARLV